MSSSISSSGTRSSVRSIDNADPATRNALRYTISTRELELLQQYFVSRGQPSHRRSTPPGAPKPMSPIPDEDYNAAAVRVSVRLFIASYSGLKLWELLAKRFLGSTEASIRTSLWRSPNLRLSLSLSSILFFHRLLHRFFIRLRDSIRSDDAKAFRRRNPRTAKALMSKIAPAVGASFAGFFLGVSPGDQTRITLGIYAFSRALEFLYNSFEDKGWFKSKPWWMGSWLLMPVACAQLLHAFVFDRDCFPASFGKFTLKQSAGYIQPRPETYPQHLAWPSTFTIVDSLATISKLKWPAFVSPILFPAVTTTLPAAVSSVAPITDPAHPLIRHLSCAVLHPHDPSCLRTYLSYYAAAFPPMAKFFTLVYAVMALPRNYKALLSSPLSVLAPLAARVLRTSFFLTAAIGSAWGSICLLQNILPRGVLPTGRWFISGFLAGLWAFLERGSGRGNFVYSARMSLDSMWKVGRKHGYWRGVVGGDVVLFVTSLAVINVVYERDPKAVSGGFVRKSLGMLRGDGWADRAGRASTKERDVKAIGVDPDAESTAEGTAEKKHL